jgi:hypothetical protein
VFHGIDFAVVYSRKRAKVAFGVILLTSYFNRISRQVLSYYCAVFTFVPMFCWALIASIYNGVLLSFRKARL